MWIKYMKCIDKTCLFTDTTHGMRLRFGCVFCPCFTWLGICVCSEAPKAKRNHSVYVPV